MAERKAIHHEAPSPLVLLRHLRETMASSDGTQGKFDRLVRMIAEQMHSEVCSIYLIRPGQVLELVASAGLNPSAIHYTRLLVGQGLVGDIAATDMDALSAPTVFPVPSTSPSWLRPRVWPVSAQSCSSTTMCLLP